MFTVEDYLRLPADDRRAVDDWIAAHGQIPSDVTGFEFLPEGRVLFHRLWVVDNRRYTDDVEAEVVAEFPVAR